MPSEIKNDRIARYLDLISDDRAQSTLEELFQRMTGGVGEPQTLPAVCSDWDVPYGRVLVWLMADEKRYAVYKRALEVGAHQLVSEAVGIADVEPGTTDAGATDSGAVAHAKLRIDTRFRVAKHHARELYGETDAKGGSGITVIVNRGGAEPPLGETLRVSESGRTLTVGA